jgi:hypothetical protein
MIARIAAIASGLALTACSVVGIREAEEPRYSITAHVGDIEIRQYGPRIAAETLVAANEASARNEGFRLIAGYIFGANTARTQIAMTAPVAQSALPSPTPAGQTIDMTAPVAQMPEPGGQWRIQFFMPAQWTLQTLPVPNDTRVTLALVPAQTYAVLRFSGAYGEKVLAARRQELLAALAARGWRVTGEPVAWFYDPPWTLPFLRRNEMAVPVAAPAG